MKKIISKKEYDTERSTIVKKVTHGSFGDANGYEETLYVTEGGNYFLYVRGGVDSKYTTENIKRLSEKAAMEWKAKN